MNKSHTINSQAELERLIERYFEGETSLQEEQTLRQQLAECPWESEIIDEARFTMGYFTAHQRQQQQRPAAANRYRVMAIAASVALLLTVGTGLLWHSQQPKDVCIAYVNGQEIHNDEAVMALIENDLNNINNASQGMASQLMSLGEAIELDNE